MEKETLYAHGESLVSVKYDLQEYIYETLELMKTAMKNFYTEEDMAKEKLFKVTIEEVVE